MQKKIIQLQLSYTAESRVLQGVLQCSTIEYGTVLRFSTGPITQKLLDIYILATV
jgi:hypothetical protein